MEFICFTASKGGVGTSQVVAKTAMALSKNGFKCVAVDMHAKRRMLDIYMGADDAFVYDINDVLDGVCSFDDALISISDNLFFMPCSQTREIENYINAFDLIYEKAKDFDFVLLDVPYEKCEYNTFSKTVLVTNCDRASIRCTEKLSQDLQNCKKYLIINKIDVDLIQSGCHMNVDDICDICAVSPIGLIPYEPEFFNDISSTQCMCGSVFENISHRLNDKYVCAIDFITTKKSKKIFSRR